MKKAFFILLFLVSAIFAKAKNIIPDMLLADTADLVMMLDSSTIVINGDIPDKQYWSNVIVNNQTFINYFKNGSNQAVNVHIREIEILEPGIYRFKILNRPVIRMGGIRLTSWCDYIVKCAPHPISKKMSIIKITFGDCEI